MSGTFTGTFAGRIREAAKSFTAAEPFSAADLGDRAGIQTRQEKRRMQGVVNDFLASGELRRVDRGVYLYSHRRPVKREKQAIMWDYFRMRKKCGACVTVEELQETAGATRDYVTEWLAALVRMGVARALAGGRFQLLKDPVEMPRNEDKAERLRRIRRIQKEAKTLLDEACVTMARVADLLDGLDGDGGSCDTQAEEKGDGHDTQAEEKGEA